MPVAEITITAFDVHSGGRLEETYNLISNEIIPGFNRKLFESAMSETNTLGAFGPGEELIGVSVVDLDWAPKDAPPSTAWLSYLAVTRRLQRRQLHIGSRLLACSEHLVTLHSDKTALGVDATAASIGLYTGNDYRLQSNKTLIKDLNSPRHAELAASCTVRHTL